MEKNTNNSPEEMEKNTNNSQSENSLSIPLYEEEPSSSSSLWDWSDLLDLSVDAPFDLLQNPLLFTPLHHSYPILHPGPDSEPYPLQFDPINEPGRVQKHDSPRPDPNTEVNEHVQFHPDPIDGPGQDSGPDPIRPESVGQLGRVRKRDPRLTCENFLAGRVPCACPEMDALLLEGEGEGEGEEEEEEGLPEKKRSRKRAVKPNKKGAVEAVVVRCQVVKCGADISGLKGYHKRHRVCLGCANAKVVVLDGVGSRYCQQCGKFHILSDFDEGKRSCRRKLERHNNRRRRKSNDPSVSVEKESEGNVLSDDLACEDAYGKGRVPLSEPEEGKRSISVPCSSSSPQNVQSDSVLTFTASDETQIDFEKDESKTSPSNGYKDKKSDYSSVVPTGRISFKLYDWNPAEFPRRLRHQIFQWLASMPVELEGYIRPGCIILTAFVAMPSFMWLKVLQEPVVYVGDLVAGPGKMLSGRGAFLVYLDNMVFRVLRDGSSVMRIKVEERTPKLHYVRPACFEAGKPLEFVACGSNLLQPNFRFLVSFGGKYLAVDYSIVLQHTGTEEVTSSDNQLLKIYIPHTDPDLFGPAFIEVENQSGLSNFLPVLIGNQEICSEMKIIEQKLEEPISSRRSKLGVISSSSDSSEVSSRQASFSHFILDTAWLIRRPALEDIKHTPLSFQIGRLNNLLEVHIQNKSTVILVRVLDYIKTIMDLNSSEDGLTSTDVELLKNNVALAKQIISGTLEEDNVSLLQSSNLVHNATWFGETADSPSTYKDSETIEDRKMKVCYNFDNNSDTIALLNKDAFTNTTLMKEKTPTRYLSRAFTKKYVISRPLAFAVASASAVCFCVCAVFIHPQEVGKIVTTIRRSLFDNS